MKNMSNTTKTFFFLAVVVLAAALTYLYYVKSDEKTDITDVTPPPAPEEEVEWEIASGDGYTFRYPTSLDTEYVHLLDWPPAVQVLDESFSCTPGGEEIDRAGQTELITEADSQYCRTMVVEGAAGSVYTQYAYAFPAGERTVILTFSTRVPQCANYDEPQKTACEEERSSVDIDALADSVIRTLSLD